MCNIKDFYTQKFGLGMIIYLRAIHFSNFSGFISFENVKRVTEILGICLTDEEIQEMIDDADKDFDEYVS